MKTVIETSTFSAKATRCWAQSEHEEFIVFIASNYASGPIVSGSGGVRKIRWGKAGQGERGGVRIVYFVSSVTEQIWLLTMYAKNERENIPAHELKRIKQVIDDETDE